MAEDKKTPSAEKLKALQNAMEKIDKQFGKGAIMKLGDDKIEDVPVIPTGSVGLNIALGVGGYPRGRVIEIYGPESSGKTTLAIHAMAEVQKQGGIAAIIDAEHAFDRFYAEKLGVDTDNLLIAQPDCGEQALDIADELIRSAAVDLVVIDSVAALTPKAEIEGDMGDNRVGLQARLMSQALRKLTATINKTQTTCIFINQLREKIGVMFGNPETTTGGNALKFYASVRIDIRKALFHAFAERGWAMIGMESLGMSLEDIFVSLVDTVDGTLAGAKASKGNRRGARAVNHEQDIAKAILDATAEQQKNIAPYDGKDD